MTERYLGIDLGAETIKIAELLRVGSGLVPGRRWLVEHHKEPAEALAALLPQLDWAGVSGAAGTGRGSRMLDVERVPTKAALVRGLARLHPEVGPCTLVTIGSHGFGVLEVRGPELHVFRENSRCSQGTGNFLRQLVERFDLTIDEASAMCEGVADAAPLSGRCPVILKTDMTHLANKGEDRARILAGLYDAVCENVQVLLKPELCPPKVLLVGGVSRSERVRAHFRRFLETRGMALLDGNGEEDLFLEAFGAADVAAQHAHRVPAADQLVVYGLHAGFDTVPSLAGALPSVRRMTRPPVTDGGRAHRVVLGFDIGSTGSKMVALDAAARTPVWEGYLNTLGNPVAAARTLAERFLAETEARHEVLGIGATGSGREIVGSLMRACFGRERVFVLNEIAAHAEGALSFDGEVDTIFEIGGQDAKYIRLDGGRIVDAAMNEACSAGTGSFIEEQGKKFQNVANVVQMGRLALEAETGISLGQHCSVFMAEVIDEAVAAGVPQPSILAGIYDSIIQNYLNRVKGARSVGTKIFCQGMPFMADALAAAVARQTGRAVVVPPNPGTIGALGIALLAAKELPVDAAEGLALALFLTSQVDRKDTFVCASTKGCGGSGNKCRIDRIHTTVNGQKQKFVWGGNCSLYDGGTGKRKLPDLAPDPFRERQALLDATIAPALVRRGRPLVAMTDEFTLKGMTPFFATFVHGLGFDVRVYSNAGHASLKRGIEEANIPFCAPMQLYQGVVAQMVADGPDIVLAPRLRELPRQKDERFATLCPIVQASPDIVRKVAEAGAKGAAGPLPQILLPRVDIGQENYGSARFFESAKRIAEALGVREGWEVAFERARAAQEGFETACLGLGRRALDFAAAHGVVPVVVLGRAYTIYNDVLNSNVPNILREQGALAIPVDCFPVDVDVPVFEDLYWGYSQQNLRAAHQIRRTDGVYSVFCSNYSCGPDSFNLHFYAYVMENKPFSIIETDGHSGDAGTKTRIEAFLFCVEGDRRLAAETRRALPRTNFKAIEVDKQGIGDTRRRGELMLVPRMGVGAELITEVLRSEGVRAECLPMPTREALATGRRHTSGKECVPMTLTTGSLLERIEQDRDTDERFAFFMPTANGPCRFGVYNLLHKIILEKTGWKDRVRIVSPGDQDYFAEMSPDFQVRAWVGFVAADLLLAALHDVRPVETVEGAAQDIYDRAMTELKALIRTSRPGKLVYALGELPNGMFGVRNVLRRAAEEFRTVKDFSKDLPTVSVVGEIYVRLDPFANDFVVQKLEARGVKSIVAPFDEWLEYTTFLQKQRIAENKALPGDSLVAAQITYAMQAGVMNRLYGEMATALAWGPRTTVEESIAAARPYIDPELTGEAVLTLGGPVHEWDAGHIDGVVSVGPHECMPNKVSEAQFCHVAEEKGLLSLTLPLNGDPVDPEILDRFAFEVKERHAKRAAEARRTGHRTHRSANPGTLMLAFQGKALLTALKVLTPLAHRHAAKMAAAGAGGCGAGMAQEPRR